MMSSDPRVHTYYRNEHGRSAADNPIDIRRIWAWTRDPTGEPEDAFDSCIQPYFGQDLLVD